MGIVVEPPPILPLEVLPLGVLGLQQGQQVQQEGERQGHP